MRVKEIRGYPADLHIKSKGPEMPCILHVIADDHDENKKAKKFHVEVKEVPVTTPWKYVPITVKLTTTELPSGMCNF